MTLRDVAHCRLVNQQISCGRSKEPHEVVSALGAMQAQDYLGGLWAVGLRLPSATETAVELAIAERKIIRTWPMRGTLHFVAAQDAGWMLELMTPGPIGRAARRFQQLELDEKVFSRSRKLFVRALCGNRQLTRGAMMDLLEGARISPAGQRGIHILWRLAQEGLLCFAAREGKQQTFALLEEWAPQPSRPSREAAMAELARRYFTGHGPATLQDFVWWTGLKISDARAALNSVCSQLSQQVIDGISYWMTKDLQVPPAAARSVHLLPGFDEYLLGYRDRSAVLEPHHSQKINPGGNGMFQPAIVIDGRVTGTWKRVLKKNEVVVTASPFTPLKKAAKNAIAPAAERYSRFLSLKFIG